MAKTSKIKEQDLNYDKNSLYFGYSTRVLVLIILFALLTILCILVSYKLINYQEKNNIKLIEVGKISHQAVLKDNTIYNKNIIDEKDSLKYLSSLTNKILLNYNYKVVYDRQVKGYYNTKVFGELSIYNKKTGSKYYLKRYEIKDETKTIYKSSTISYNDKITIDYNNYNIIAKEFINKYNKDSKAKLDIYLVVDNYVAPVNYKEYKKIDSKMIASISLGEDEIEILKESIDDGKEIQFKQKTQTMYSLILEILIIILIIFIIIVFLKLNNLLSKLQPKDSEYEKELKRILKEYDNIIVNVSILPDENKYKKVIINDFEELLDLKDNVKEPIRYIEIAPHTKSYFFIKHNDEVFIYTLKNTSDER